MTSWLVTALVATLAACSSAPRSNAPASAASPDGVAASQAAASAPASAASAPPMRITLAAEQVRLADLFRGTPVVFAMQQDGSLRVTVPRRFSFDTGSVKVKPPLVAVLDRLAKSQAQTASRMRLSAPLDPETRPDGRGTGSPANGTRASGKGNGNGNGTAGTQTNTGTLARDRANSARDHLTSQGIVAGRLVLNPAAASGDQFEIVVSDAGR